MTPGHDKENPENEPSAPQSSDLPPDEEDIWEDDEELEELTARPSPSPDAEEAGNALDPLDEDLDAEFPSQEEEPLEQTTPPPAEETEEEVNERFSRNDFIWLGALGLVFLIVAIVSLKLFFGDINTSTPDEVDFPVEGESVVVKKIDTFWRKPDREVDKGIQLNAKFIPSADIELKSSGAGALRFFFEDPKGERVGDSVTRAFSNGSFAESGKETINIYCTGGFEDVGDYNEYLTEKVHFWNLVVMEGASLDAEGSSFKEILRMRISPKRR